MKNREPHIVPLSQAAVALLLRLQPYEERRVGRVFQFRNEMNKLRLTLRKVAAEAFPNTIGLEKVTAHGTARANFQDFCTSTGHRGDKWFLVQDCLAHRRPRLDRAYSREQWLEERRRIMKLWAAYLLGAPPQKELDEFVKAMRVEA